jgi:SNF2 family DNA or RNA helicase
MTQTITFREYQTDIIDTASKILLSSGFVYLAMEVRTGKTLTSLGIANKVNAQDVLFITKKKAISSIEKDFNLLKPSFSLCVTNYESLHKIDNDIHWDLIICDEAHSMGAFPKPSNRAIAVKNLIAKHKPRVILLSGTPTPESYSQMYHQVYGIPNNPFKEFKNFYRFCDVYVKLKERMINGLMIRDYSEGLETIIEKMKPYMINYTQAEAGFNSKTTEEVLEVELKESTYKLINRLKRDLVVTGKEEVILGDTPVKLMMKMHQMYSGTVKFESGNSMVIDDSKAVFIHDNFCNYKIGIFYKFKEELVVLKSVFGDDLTTELSVFEDTNKSIALQIVSGREGISLKQADFLVYYNIDFSATSYWQSKDRMTTKDRLENKVYWVFAKDGIENEIYKAVTKKKDYTVSHFKNDFYL